MLNEEVNKYVNCKIDDAIANDAIISWINWEDYWTIVESNVTKEEEKTLCYRENTKWYVGMNSKRNFKDAFEICNSFGGTLPMPDDSRNDEILWSVIEDPTLDCKGKTWIGATDFQEEGKFIDVSKFSYKVNYEIFLKVKQHIFILLMLFLPHKDVFFGSDNVGTDFKRNPPWGNGQPRGGIVQNCVATQRSGLWTSEPCHKESCVSCLIKINQEYKLRGLCKDTLFDNRFKLVGIDPVTKKLHFIGMNGWTIKYDINNNGFSLTNSKIAHPYAVFNDTQHYPMGLKQW